SLISHYEHAAGKKDSIGAFVRTASLGVGVVLSLPAVLPGIGHGVQFLSRLVGMQGCGTVVAQFLGHSASCTSVATSNGIMGGTSALAAHLPCVIPAVIASFPLLSPSLTQQAGQKELPPDDPNHAVTPEQQAMVDAYNRAAPAQKILMQKELR